MQITTEKVLALAKQLDEHKLLNWYEFGVFLKERSHMGEADLEKEFAEWEAASVEDFVNFEKQLAETE